MSAENDDQPKTPEAETPEAPEVEQEAMDPSGKRPFKRAHVREVRNYTDGEGREVVELIQVFGKKPDPNTYRGLTTIVIKAKGPGGVDLPPRKMQFNFAIDATSVRSAFEKFDDSADASIAEWQREQRERQRIATPQRGMSLIGPDGKPIT